MLSLYTNKYFLIKEEISCFTLSLSLIPAFIFFKTEDEGNLSFSQSTKLWLEQGIYFASCSSLSPSKTLPHRHVLECTNEGKAVPRSAELKSLLQDSSSKRLRNSIGNITMSTFQGSPEPPESRARMPEKGWNAIPVNPGIRCKGKG